MILDIILKRFADKIVLIDVGKTSYLSDIRAAIILKLTENFYFYFIFWVIWKKFDIIIAIAMRYITRLDNLWQMTLVKLNTVIYLHILFNYIILLKNYILQSCGFYSCFKVLANLTSWVSKSFYVKSHCPSS